MHWWIYIPATWLIFWAIAHEWRVWRVKREARETLEMQAAIQLFIRDGKINPTFQKLTGKNFIRAVKVREANILTKEKASQDFTARCECPDCGKIDYHGFKEVIGKTVHRQCNDSGCQHVWMQG